MKEKEFLSSNQMFTARCKLHLKAGNPKPQHKRPIADGDMEKLRIYFGKHYESDPVVLQEYVWFSICYHFGRRGREGWRNLNLNSFKVLQDENNLEYVTPCTTEQTKNYQGGHKQSDLDYSDQRMYSFNSHLDPVKAYKLFIQKRNPDCDALFQTPLKSVDLAGKDHWYKKEPMGKNYLSTMMQTISRKAGLSSVYTCHCVRASTVTHLHHAGVEAKKICQITKHKNEASLNHYIHGMSSKQKKNISHILSTNLTSPENTVELHGNSAPAVPTEVDILDVLPNDFTNFTSIDNAPEVQQSLRNENSALALPAEVNTSPLGEVPVSGNSNGEPIKIFNIDFEKQQIANQNSQAFIEGGTFTGCNFHFNIHK